jgi:hypothetical protein
MSLNNIEIISHTSKPSESVARLRKTLGQTAPKALQYGISVSKIEQYQFFKDNNIPHPQWSINKEEALQWQKEGDVVLARTTIKGQTGSGIIVVLPADVMPDAKVYTKYTKKKREFRVNIFQNKVVNLREKLKQTKEGLPYIRNKANGYTTAHCKPMTNALKSLLEKTALEARKVSPSDFVGVDICYNEFYNKVFVLEVNGGPSIEGSSVQEYIQTMVPPGSF